MPELAPVINATCPASFPWVVVDMYSLLSLCLVCALNTENISNARRHFLVLKLSEVLLSVTWNWYPSAILKKGGLRFLFTVYSILSPYRRQDAPSIHGGEE